MSFYTEVIQKSPLFDSGERVNQWTLLEPETRRRVAGVIADAAEQGIEVTWWETYRSKERQELLFLQHATKLRKVGVHHYGLACDLVRVVNGEPSWKGDFEFLRPLAIKHGLIWGGAWPKFRDAYHLQRVAVSAQQKLFEGTWYPPTDYNPLQEDH